VRLSISQLLTKTFQPGAFVLTFPQSNIGETKGKLGGFMVLPASPIVMIADDNPLIVESYKDVVTNAGFIFGGPFLSCKSAEEWLSVHYPDAAILDVMLQDGSSAGLAKKLCGREIPFLVVSGYSAESEGIDEIFKSAPWLEKPVTATALESALRSLLAS
jgi:DNA-binding response OmpR family regulator